MTPTQLYKLRNKFFKRYYREFRNLLKSQVKPIVEYLEFQSHEQLLSNIPMLVQIDPIKDMYIKMYQDVGKVFGQNINEFIRKKNYNDNMQIKTIEDDIWIQMMREWCVRDCGMRISEVTAYSRELLINIIQKNIGIGIEEGMSIRQIADLIQKNLPREYGKTASWRARRIAQTEVISASNMANYHAAEQTGLNLVKKWSTRPFGFAQSLQNERHALIAQDLESQRPRMEEPFSVDGEPLMYPGDPIGSPRNTINCHCVLTYETI